MPRGRRHRKSAAVAAVAAIVLALTRAAEAATYTWTGGGGANTNWSSPANWGGSAPANGESGVALVFPGLAGAYASNNDRTGLGVNSIAITTQLGDGTYLFTGNSITASGSMTMASPGSGSPNLVWQIPVALGGDLGVATSGRQTRWSAPIDLGNRTLTIEADGDLRLSGVISGSGNLIKNRSSALELLGANTYTGATTGNGGALYIGNAAAFGGAGTGTAFTGGSLGFEPGSAFTLSEPLVFHGGSIIAYGTPTIAAPVTLETTTSVQTFELATILTISGAIDGLGGLRKTGVGRLVLNAPLDLYQGATSVDDGILQLDAALSSTKQVTVNGGALEGDGSTLGPIEVRSSSVLAPGSPLGRLTSAGLTMTGFQSYFTIEIEGPTPITQYDSLAVNGPVDLSGAVLFVVLGYTPTVGQEFTVISQAGDQAVNGRLGYAEGATFQVEGTTFGITYKGGTGNDVVIVAGATPGPTNTVTATNTPQPVDSPTPTRTSTQTRLPSATQTATRTPASATRTATRTPSTTPTPTATPTVPFCTGDCDAKGEVTVEEIVTGVHFALVETAPSTCPRFDFDGNDRVTLPELLEAIENALAGCGS